MSITKLEKADVLELTLKHLQELRRQKVSSNQGMKGQLTTEAIKKHFNSGYKACAAEVGRYLESMPMPKSNLASSSYHDSKPINVNAGFGSNLMAHLGKHLQLVEMGSSFLPFPQSTQQHTTQPLSVNTYFCNNDLSKTMPHLPTPSSTYRNPCHPASVVPTIAVNSHFNTGLTTTAGRTLSSSSDCGYSSGRDSVSPHSSLASTALSPISSRGEIDCSPASPKINVEDLDEEDSVAVDMTNQNPLNLVQRPTSSESVWRPF